MKHPPFAKGNPGGPGRPKGTSYSQRCKKFMETEGWDKVEAVARELTGKDRTKFYLALEAVKLIASYAYGRPAQQMDITSHGKSISDILGQVLAGGTSISLPEANIGQSESLGEGDVQH